LNDIQCRALISPINRPVFFLRQLVVFLAKHDREGSVGFILNRPAPVTIGGLMGWGFARPEVRSRAPRPGSRVGAAP